MKVYWSSLMIVMMSTIGLSTPALAGSASAELNFTMTFVGGSCDISAPSSVKFNNGNAFSSAEIEQNTAATNESFELTLSSCAGWGLTPSIKVSGAKTTDFGEALFHSIGGPIDAKGYGILLKNLGNTTFRENTNLAANGTILANNDWSTNTQLSTVNNTTLPMIATLTCGDCNSPLRQGGDFSATVTFDFVYD